MEAKEKGTWIQLKHKLASPREAHFVRSRKEPELLEPVQRNSWYNIYKQKQNPLHCENNQYTVLKDIRKHTAVIR